MHTSLQWCACVCVYVRACAYVCVCVHVCVCSRVECSTHLQIGHDLQLLGEDLIAVGTHISDTHFCQFRTCTTQHLLHANLRGFVDPRQILLIIVVLQRTTESDSDMQPLTGRMSRE